MNDDFDLWKAFDEWRHWTEVEGEAIRLGNWIKVSECQSAKERLQPLISSLHEAAAAAGGERFSSQLKYNVDTLLALEHQNQKLLQSMLDAAKGERQELDRVQKNLRRVQKSYTFRAPENWQSYS